MRYAFVVFGWIIVRHFNMEVPIVLVALAVFICISQDLKEVLR